MRVMNKTPRCLLTSMFGLLAIGCDQIDRPQRFENNEKIILSESRPGPGPFDVGYVEYTYFKNGSEIKVHFNHIPFGEYCIYSFNKNGKVDKIINADGTFEDRTKFQTVFEKYDEEFQYWNNRFKTYVYPNNKPSN